jgi:uncharacterized protein
MGRGLWTEWDDEKRAANRAKHGIDFAELDECFQDERRIVREDTRAFYGERRYNMLVLARGAAINVTFSPRGGLYRLISARPANRVERRLLDERREV